MLKQNCYLTEMADLSYHGHCFVLDLTFANLCSPEQISRDVCSKGAEHNFQGLHHWQFTECNADRDLIHSAY